MGGTYRVQITPDELDKLIENGWDELYHNETPTKKILSYCKKNKHLRPYIRLEVIVFSPRRRNLDADVGISLGGIRVYHPVGSKQTPNDIEEFVRIFKNKYQAQEFSVNTRTSAWSWDNGYEKFTEGNWPQRTQKYMRAWWD
jgi:hypothetical protein